MLVNEENLLESIQQDIDAEPHELTHRHRMIIALASQNKVIKAMSVLDELELTHKDEDSRLLRDFLIGRLAEPFNPIHYPEELKERAHWIYEELIHHGVDAIENDGFLAYLFYLNTDCLDAELSHYFLTRSAINGHGMAQVLLGNRYLVGKGVEKNLRLAYKWTYRSSLKGNPLAYNNLGMMHLEGIGLPINYEKAYINLRKANEAGIDLSLLELGDLLYQGKGTAKNTEEAKLIWMRGKDKGQAACTKRLEQFFRPEEYLIYEDEVEPTQ